MNLVPWFPEIAVLGGAVALIPALAGMRRAPQRPALSTYAEPALIALVAMVVLDGLISARTGASFALGAIAALSVQWMAGFGIAAGVLGVSAWGASLLGLGLVFELFGSAAAMDDGGWRLFAQLIAAFALGSATITATRRGDGATPESADAGVFAAAGALIIAAATPFVANRVDGVAFPMLLAAAGLAPNLVALDGKAATRFGFIPGALIATALVAVAASGLDPVALGLHDAPDPQATPLLAALVGILLGTAIRLAHKPKWTVALGVIALVPLHFLGPYGTAVAPLAAMAAIALPAAPGKAATVIAALALVVASHSGSPLVTPSHWSGWFHTFVAALVVGVVGALGKGPRFALVRVAVLTWIVIAPFLS